MIFLLNNWRLILTVLVIGVLAAYGQFWKWRAGVWEERYETYRIEVSAVAAAAKAASEAKKAAQDKTTKEVRNVSKADRDRIAAYYGLRLPKSGGGTVPAPADGPKGTDAPPGEPASSGTCVAAEGAALDAEQVLAWQAWARGQGLPVE